MWIVYVRKCMYVQLGVWKLQHTPKAHRSTDYYTSKNEIGQIHPVKASLSDTNCAPCKGFISRLAYMSLIPKYLTIASPESTRSLAQKLL